jgi:hypothetical protein
MWKKILWYTKRFFKKKLIDFKIEPKNLHNFPKKIQVKKNLHNFPKKIGPKKKILKN